LALAVVVTTCGVFGFVLIPYWVGAFRAASAIPDVRAVSGNGGSAVMVGEYLYFVDGFTSKDDYEYKQNNYNKVKSNGQGAIWRVRIRGGSPEYDNSYLVEYLSENGVENIGRYLDPTDTVFYDKQINDAMNKVVAGSKKDGNLELIVPKIAGWENTALWVFGDTLIYTSPNNEKDRNGRLQRDKIDFFKCNLRGKKHKRIYTTKYDEVASGDFTVVWAGEPYLVINDGVLDKDGNLESRNLLRVDMKGKVKTISDKVEHAVFPYVTGYHAAAVVDAAGASLDGSYSGIMGYIYYTEAVDAENEVMKSGNKLFRWDYSGTEAEKLHNNGDKFDLQILGNGRLVFKRTPYEESRTRLYTVSDGNTNVELGRLNQVEYWWEELEESDDFRVSGERTLASLFRILSVNGNSVTVWNPIDNVPPIIFAAGKILAVTADTMIYEGGEGEQMEGQTYSECNYFNQNSVPRTVNLAGVEGSLVSHFRVLDAQGVPTGDSMMFFVNRFSIDEDFIQVGCARSFVSGREFAFARVDVEKYIAMPQTIVENAKAK
jgi:hypothetical protein